MKHKEHILIGLLYLLSPFIGQLLVEHTHFIGTEFTGTAYVICWLSVVISIHAPIYYNNLHSIIRLIN